MLTLRNISKKFSNGHRALHNINLSIASGDFIYVTGESGAGKSTLLNIISGVETASHGDIQIGKLRYSKLGVENLWMVRQELGIVTQTPMLISDETVFYNVALPLTIQNTPELEIKKKVRAVLELVGLNKKANYIVSNLSGGEQQRVAIARSISNKPRFIIADEPTGNLDPKLSLEILKLFIDFNRVGVGVIIATHDMSLMHHFKARQIILDSGQIKADISIKDNEDIKCSA